MRKNMFESRAFAGGGKALVCLAVSLFIFLSACSHTSRPSGKGSAGSVESASASSTAEGDAYKIVARGQDFAVHERLIARSDGTFQTNRYTSWRTA